MDRKPGQRPEISNQLNQFRQARSSEKSDETTSENEEPQLAQRVSASTVQAGVVSADLDVINDVSTTIDTSVLEDIDRLVDAGLVDRSAIDGAKLEALIGKPGLVTDSTSAVSSGGAFDVLSQRYMAGGSPTFTYPGGSVLTGTSPGTGVVHTPTGTVEFVTVLPGGTTLNADQNGTSVRTVDGVVTTQGPDSYSVQMPDGVKTVVGFDGTTTTITADGTQTIVGVDGSVTTILPGGVVIMPGGELGTQDPVTGEITPAPAGGGSPGDSPDTPGQSASGGSAGGSSNSDSGGDGDSSDDDDDDDDDSSSDPPAAEDTDSADSGQESDSDDSATSEEGTPNPMNEEPSGPPIWLVTDGRLGGDEQSNVERAINVASGGGHTTPLDEAAGSNLEFLASPVGREQVKQDVAAVEQARTGGVTDPSPLDDTPSGMPTVEDLERIEFIVEGGGLVNPVSAAVVDDDDDEQVPAIGVGDLAAAAGDLQVATDLNHVPTDLTSLVTEDLQSNIDKSSIEIDVDKIDDISG